MSIQHKIVQPPDLQQKNVCQGCYLHLNQLSTISDKPTSLYRLISDSQLLVNKKCVNATACMIIGGEIIILASLGSNLHQILITLRRVCEGRIVVSYFLKRNYVGLCVNIPMKNPMVIILPVKVRGSTLQIESHVLWVTTRLSVVGCVLAPLN